MNNEIKKLRTELDSLDDRISDLISERVKTARKIVEIKGRNDMPKDDFSRESAILNRISELHPENSELLKEIYGRIFDWVKNH